MGDDKSAKKQEIWQVWPILFLLDCHRAAIEVEEGASKVLRERRESAIMHLKTTFINANYCTVRKVFSWVVDVLSSNLSSESEQKAVQDILISIPENLLKDFLMLAPRGVLDYLNNPYPKKQILLEAFGRLSDEDLADIYEGLRFKDIWNSQSSLRKVTPLY